MHTCRLERKYNYTFPRCFALDVAGDKSSIEERRQYLKEVDTDMTEGVDLEEFLMVRHS